MQVELAKMSSAARILVATERGNAPRLVSSYRPGIPVTAVTDSLTTARESSDTAWCGQHCGRRICKRF